MLATLAHCIECNVWLRPDQGCQHILPLPRQSLNDASGDRAECDGLARAPFFHEVRNAR